MALMIETRILKGVAKAAGNDGTRAYLCGVMVQVHTKENAGELWYDERREGLAQLVATNGHIMAVGDMGIFIPTHTTPDGVTHNPETWAETIIPADMVKAILRVKVSKELARKPVGAYFWLERLEGGALRAVFPDGQTVQGFKAVDDSYPDFKRVLNPTHAYKDKPGTQGVGFNADYVARIGEIAACIGHPKAPSVQIFTCDATQPALFETKGPNHERGLMLLMPMRL